MHAPIEGLLENILAMGLKTEVELLEFDYVPATAEVAAALGAPPGPWFSARCGCGASRAGRSPPHHLRA